MKTVVVIIILTLVWNLILSILQSKFKSKSKNTSIFSAILSLIFSPKINLSSYSLSNQKEPCQDIEKLVENNPDLDLVSRQEASYPYLIKPEYSVVHDRVIKNNHSINVMGSIISLQLSENESLTALKAMLDEAISSTSNLNQKESSSIISSSIPACIINGNDIHAICYQIKSLAAKYRFDPAKFENFIQR